MSRAGWVYVGLAVVALALGLALWPKAIELTEGAVIGHVSCGSVLSTDSPNYHCHSPLRERGVVVSLIATVGFGVVGIAARRELALCACIALVLLVLVGGARSVSAGDNDCGAVFTGMHRESPCAEETRDQIMVTVVPALALVAVGAARATRRTRPRSSVALEGQR